MSQYIGPWRRSPVTGFLWRTICFTGWQAIVVRLWLVGFIALEGAAIGFIIGLFLSILGIAVTAELPPLTVLSIAVGAATTVLSTEIGAAVGGIAGAILAYMASCPTCGVCIELAFHMIMGRLMPVIPILILPRTVDCTVLIPPGCP